MKILFVASGNTDLGIREVVKNQADSLKENGVDIDIFAIKGKGYFGYLKHISVLRCHLKNNQYDLIHAHYSNCLIISYISKTSEKLGVSFMGSDILARTMIKQKIIFLICKWLVRNKCDFVIVKTNEMASVINFSEVKIIPNGVNFKDFYPFDKNQAKNYLNIDTSIRLIIFVSDPSRREKNYNLALKACEIIEKDNRIKLLPVYNKPKEELKYYYSAADLLILSSLHEGGVNVIKEAMACNCPIVSTDVGDVREVIGNTEGCYICSYDPADVADKIKLALSFSETKGQTNGRQRIMELELDSVSVVKRILEVYEKVIKNKGDRVMG